MPEGLAEALASGAGWLAGSVFRVRRSEVDRHLALAFPERDRAWRRQVGVESYRHLGREGVAMLRMAELDREAVLRRTRTEGLDGILRAVEAGRGAVIVTGHLGNWEIGAAAVAARGLSLAAVALRQGNPLFDRDLVRTRERLGFRVVYKKDAPREVLRILRDGGAVAVVGDQNPIRGGVPVDFFGRPANTARGPAVFALRSGAPVFVGAALRTSGSDPRYVVSFERVAVERTGDLDADVRRLVQAYTSRLEDRVRRAPEQYFWQHRRWKERE